MSTPTDHSNKIVDFDLKSGVIGGGLLGGIGGMVVSEFLEVAHYGHNPRKPFQHTGSVILGCALAGSAALGLLGAINSKNASRS